MPVPSSPWPLMSWAYPTTADSATPGQWFWKRNPGRYKSSGFFLKKRLFIHSNSWVWVIYMHTYNRFMVDWPYHYILYLSCPNSMTAHVDDIIKATSDLVIPLHGAIGAIPRKEVTCWHKDEFPEKQQRHSDFSAHFNVTCVYFLTLCTRIRLTVGLNESPVVVMNGPGHTRPRLSYTQSSRYVVGSQLFSLKKIQAHNIMSYIRHYLQHICEVLYGRPHKTKWISKPSKCPACVFVCFRWVEGREISSETPVQLSAQSVLWE